MSFFTRKIATVDNALAVLTKITASLDDVQMFQVAESDKQMDRAKSLRLQADKAELDADEARQEAMRAQSIKRNLLQLLS